MQTVRNGTRGNAHRVETFDTVVIGGGQAGLAVGYHLAKRSVNFVILDAGKRVGDTWRNRWDTLRLFTPARYNGLPGMPFPALPYYYPTKDEMADYLEAYATHFELPVRSGVRVDRLSRSGERYTAIAGEQCFEAKHVVVAMGAWQVPRVPHFAGELHPDIVKLHSSQYRNPTQLREGGVLVVGAGNSGAEIALEAVQEHPTWLAGKHRGQVPFRLESAFGRHVGVPVVIGFLFHHVLTPDTPMGRKMREKFFTQGGMLVRTKAKDLLAAGVQRVPKVTGVRAGLPLLEDGEVLDVANVIWSTGFTPAFSWIDLPVLGKYGQPRHQLGVVPDEPGLYFVGLPFIRAASSAIVRGVGRDAELVSETVASRLGTDLDTREGSPVREPARLS